MLSQFSKEGNHPTLADLDFKFPKDVYPVGRLDADSEGLLLLTNDTSLNHLLLNPKRAHKRTYLVQVDGQITSKAVQQLENGIDINVNGNIYHTLPAKVNLPETVPLLPERNPPIRFRKSIPTSWLYLTLTEGKNRQVRKMTASVGFPTLRLIRFSFCGFTAEGMTPGEIREVKRHEIQSST